MNKGIKWGPFTFRIPIIHTSVKISELLQGIFVAAATGMSLAPVLMSSFGLNFEEAVAASLVFATLMSFSWFIFGEPYCPGWITPALPFTLAFVLSDNFTTPTERFHAMSALSIDLALILIVFGITGMGKWIMRYLPVSLKAGIILGAAFTAFYQIFNLQGAAGGALQTQPVSAALAVVVCMLLAFSLPLKKLKMQVPLVAKIAGLGLLPGFIIAAIVGPFVGEIEYNIQGGIMWPPLVSVWQKSSPFVIGLPDLSVFIECLPLAFIGYILVFGDIITGNEIIKDAQDSRPDEKISLDTSRTHFSLGIRNALMAISTPFFPTQGILWTGVHVVVVNRWKEGKETMGSLFDGISSYYVLMIPLVFMFAPLVTGLRPLLGIALLLTLMLTAFACSYIALQMTRNATEQGVAVMSAVGFTLFDPIQGILFASIATFVMVGVRSVQEPVDESALTEDVEENRA